MKLKSSIRIAMKTKGQLKDLKSRGETYDTVIKRLLKYRNRIAKLDGADSIFAALENIEEDEK